MRLDQLTFRVRRALHRFACRFGWHIGGNLSPWYDDSGRYRTRCLWCEADLFNVSGEWRES